ncbi:MAG: amidohydrolase family protein [Sphingomonadales bacterium]|nr:amidohydrolase family protein [Sphingomonadales bacterium]
MDIVDAQVHVGRGQIGATLEAMDSLGIASVLIDEYWGGKPGAHPSHIQPGFALPGGGWRALSPTAEEAALLHPGRFAYLVRIDPADPQLEAVMRAAAANPAVRAFRIQPVWTLAEADAFARGRYDALFDLAQDIGLPVCAFIPGHAEPMARYLERYPRQQIIIDHCGMGFPQIPPGRSAEAEARANDPAYFAEVLKLARFPNAAMKWSHAQTRLGVPHFPYEGLRPHLRAAITAFGADRLMWASDKTVMFGHTWSDLLHGLRDDPELSTPEKTAILGATARRLLNWPAVS